MVRVEVLIKPFRLTDMHQALMAVGVRGMTVTEMLCFGSRKGHVELYRGEEYRVDFIPKLMLMIVINEAQLADVMNIIQKVARTGKIGDTTIFVSSVDDVMRIRTGETGKKAL